MFERWRLEDFEVVAFCYTPLPTLAIQPLIQKDEVDSKDCSNNNHNSNNKSSCNNNNYNTGQQAPIPTLFFVDPLTIVEGGVEAAKRSKMASCSSPTTTSRWERGAVAAEVPSSISVSGGATSSSSSSSSVSGGVAVVTSRMMRASTSANLSGQSTPLLQSHLSEQSTPLLQSPLNACEEEKVDDEEQEEGEGIKGEGIKGVAHNHVGVDDDIDHGGLGRDTLIDDDANIVSLADVISHDEMQSMNSAHVVSVGHDNDATNAFNSFLLREGEREKSDTETIAVIDGSHNDFTSSLSLSTSKDNAHSADIVTPHELLLPEVVVAVKSFLNTTYKKLASKDDSCINTRPMTTTRVDNSFDDDGHVHANSLQDDDSIVTNETATVAVRRNSWLMKTQSADNLLLTSYHHHHHQCDRLDSIGEDLNSSVEQSLLDADDFIFHHQSTDNLLDVITNDQSSDHHPAAAAAGIIIDPTIVSRHESSEAMIGGNDQVSAIPTPIDIFSMKPTSTDHDNTSNRKHQQQYQYQQYQYQQQVMSRRQVRKFYGAQITSQQITSQQSRQLKRASTRQLWSLMRQQVLYCN